jgi:hypothetical protein
MWLEEYERLLRSPQQAFQAAVDLKRQHFPRSLFKYRSVNRENLDALRRNYVWMARAKDLNDPYDCATQLSFDAGFEDIFRASLRDYLAANGLADRLTEAEIQDILSSEAPSIRTAELTIGKQHEFSATHAAAFSQAIQSVLQQRGTDMNRHLAEQGRTRTNVCSFSADGTSTVLWAAYANANQGYCVEYAPDDLPPEGIILRFLCPVLYRDGVYDGTECFLAGVRLGPNPLTVRWPILSATRKNRKWEHEQEWRIIEPDGMTPQGGMALAMPSPRAVYLGMNMPLADEKRILEILAYQKVPAFRMATGPDSGALLPVAFSSNIGPIP